MDMLVEIFLMFVLPSLAAFLAVGSAGKKLAWYAGTLPFPSPPICSLVLRSSLKYN
jgi:hypothetical protein